MSKRRSSRRSFRLGVRPVRSACRKVAYRDEVAAKLTLAEARWKDGSRRSKLEVRAYKCPKGNHWHLTSSSERTDSTPR